jgi:hypothetical protein
LSSVLDFAEDRSDPEDDLSMYSRPLVTSDVQFSGLYLLRPNIVDIVNIYVVTFMMAL